MSDPERLHVERDGRTDPYFSGAAQGRLMIRRCRSCGHSLAPESGGCAGCGGADLAWVAASGRGTLVSWSLLGAEGEAVLALVELAEGPWIHSRLVGVEPAAVRVGLPLAAVFVHPEQGESFPMFTAQ